MTGHRKLLGLFLVIGFYSATAQQTLAPVRIESPLDKENAIVITAVGEEHDPIAIKGAWNADDHCLSEIACFVASWIEANSTGNLDQIVQLRFPAEQAELERRLRQNPNLLQANASRFRVVQSWSLLGSVRYGPFEVVLLAKQDPTSSTGTYTLPLRRVNSRWAQTDALANDAGVYAVIDRIADAVMKRHRPAVPRAK